MTAMTPAEIAEALAGPHQAILAVARQSRGPVAVPMSYHFAAGRFVMVTSPESLHGRLMLRRGRATVTVQYEECDGRKVHQWYVTAEGPVRFVDDDPRPVVRTILVKDRGAANADGWLGDESDPGVKVAILDPERLAGYRYRASLDD